MTQNGMHALKADLIFSKGYDTTSANLLRAPLAFIEAFERTHELIISGDQNDDVVIHTSVESFKMKGIGLSRTLLVVDSKGIIHHQSTGFLEVEHFDPPYSEICNALIGIISQQITGPVKDCSDEDLRLKCSLPKSFIRTQFKLNEDEYEKLAQAMNIAYQSSTDTCLFLPNHIVAELMREIITYLASKNLPLSSFSQEMLGSGLPVARGLILQYLVEFFNIAVKESENGSMYCISSDVICHYVVLEMAMAKQQYTKTQFHELAEEMLAIYLPAQCEKPSLHPSLWLYFIEKKETFEAYDYMAIDPELLNRLKFLNSVKRRWRLEQIRAVLRGIPTQEQDRGMEISELLAKKFRKYGDEYEIRMVLPK